MIGDSETRGSRLRAAAMMAMLVASLGIPFFAVRYLPEPIVDWILEIDSRPQAELWAERTVNLLDRGVSGFANRPLSDAEVERLAHIPEVSDYYRVKLLDNRGQVYWSTRPDDIGTVDMPGPVAERLTRGNLYLENTGLRPSDAAEMNQHAHHQQSAHDRAFYEIYVPVIRNSTFVGAVKFYADAMILREMYEKSVSEWIFVAACFVLAVMIGVTGLMAYLSRKQVSKLKKRAQEEREMMDRQVKLAREVRLLGELNEWLQSSRSLNELFDMVAQFMKHILPESEGSLYVYSNSRDVLDGAVSWNGGKHHDHIHPEACWALRRGRVYHFGHSEVDFACEHSEPNDGRPYFCLPILALGETIGLLHLRKNTDTTRQEFEDSRRLAQMCGEQISMALANVRMRDQLEERSIRDPLTGLFNRRHMLDSMRRLIVRADAGGSRLHGVYIDVDHFKKFNDNHGHDAGDMVLRAVGDLLLKSCDGDEIACRMGGEEFMLLLPDLAIDVLKTRIETLRREVANISIRYGEKTLPKITISAGIASYPDHGTMPQDLLCAADKALYEAKDGGRNRVVMATRPSPMDGADAAGPAPAGKPPHNIAAQ